MDVFQALSEENRREAQQIRQKVESGSICGQCYRADCDRIIAERAVWMRPKRGYRVITCAHKGKELQEAEDRRQAGIHTEIVVGLKKKSGIPDKFKDVDLGKMTADLENGEGIAAAHDFLNGFDKNDGRGVVFCGPVGVGKTHIGVGILNRLLDRGVPCRYLYSADLIALLRDRSRETTLLDATFREICTERCVFLDDIGVDGDTDFVIAVYTKIIDARYRNEKPTIFASNLGMAGMEQAIGTRAVSRIVETCDVVEVSGKDRRFGE